MGIKAPYPPKGPYDLEPGAWDLRFKGLRLWDLWGLGTPEP